MKRNVIYRFFLIAVAITFIFGLIMRRDLSAATQAGPAVPVKITGTFQLGELQYVRFIDPETKAVCYAATNTSGIACMKQ
jgi:hypothetical protein